MRRFNGLIGICAGVIVLGCASGLVSSWKAPDAEPLQLRGEKVAAVVMVTDQTIRLAGEDALARELTARGAKGVPMYTLLADAVPDEAKARAAAGQAGILGVVVLRPRPRKLPTSSSGRGSFTSGDSAGCPTAGAGKVAVLVP